MMEELSTFFSTIYSNVQQDISMLSSDNASANLSTSLVNATSLLRRAAFIVELTRIAQPHIQTEAVLDTLRRIAVLAINLLIKVIVSPNSIPLAAFKSFFSAFHYLSTAMKETAGGFESKSSLSL